MELLYSPTQRAERLIAASRVVLAIGSLIAVWRDPSEPAKYAEIAYALLVAYVVYAGALALVARRGAGVGRLFGLLTHSFDLAFFTLFMYFTSGPSGPFIAYFVFSLVCATLRWQWRGTLWTAIASLAAFFFLGYYFAEVVRDPDFELDDFLIRGVYMSVVAFLLGHLGLHEQRTRAEIARLAGWPASIEGRHDEASRELLGRVAEIHRAGRVAVVWTTRDGAAARLELLDGDRLRAESFGAPVEATVAPPLAGDSFLDPGGVGEDALVRSTGQLVRWRGAALAPAMRDALGEGTVLSATWRGELSTGRLFLAGIDSATSDELLLAEIAAALVGARIESRLLAERRTHEAATEERIRLARDLHDGVLQSLTGIGLRVAAIRRQLKEAPDEALAGLEELAEVVASEHRDLRFFIRDLEPPEGVEREFDLARRLAELRQRAEREWGLEVALETPLLDEDLPDATERELFFLVREAVANAARHGGARHVRVRLEPRAESGLRLTVSDDGRGLEQHGRFDAEQLARSGIGPRSLRERVGALGGHFELESVAGGLRIEMEMAIG